MQNFGKIKNAFNSLLIEGLFKEKKNNKTLFKKYLKTIKESEILKTQFLIYNNIENKIEADSESISLFISENIKLLEKYKKSDILNENKKLIKLLGEIKDELNIQYDESNLHESLSKLIFTEKTPKNIDSIVSELKNVSNYIKSNKEKEIVEHVDLPISLMTNLVVEKYNEKYSDLDEDDKKILNVLINENQTESERLYSEIVSECLSLIDNLLKNEDGDLNKKLLKVKNKLSEDAVELTKENIVENIVKLVELKNNLKNN